MQFSALAKFFLLFILLCCFIQANAQQVPQGINYQAVLRNNNGETVTDQPIIARIALVDADTKTPYYSEIHALRTSNTGVINLIIGAGKAESIGAFTDVPWSSANLSLEVSYDLDNNGTYEMAGTTRLLSVPYAFYAERAGNVPTHSATEENSARPGDPDLYWGTGGNYDTYDEKSYLGTADDQDLVIKTNGLERMRITKGTIGVFDLHNALINLEEDVIADKSVQIRGTLTVSGYTMLENDLLVAGNTVLNGDLNVAQTATIGSTLHVLGNVNVDGNTVLNEDLSVGGGESVSGDVKLGHDLRVINDVDIDHNLNVDNSTHIGVDLDVDHNLNVDVDAHIGHDLDVDHNANIDGDLKVHGTGEFYDMNILHNAHVGNDVDIDRNTTMGGTLDVDGAVTANCRLTINSCVDGSDGDISSYPLLVQGGSQGIAVKVDGSRSADNNFVSFWDGSGMQGRIEGQTSAELASDPEYIIQQAVFALNTIGLAADIAGLGVELATVEAQVLTAAEGVGIGAQVAAAVAELASLTTEIVSYNALAFSSVGVSYESGSGDYAEWLERGVSTEDLQFGQIVGVRGGKISLQTDHADHLLVISRSPIVLGNMPPAGREQAYEKVAFMGQVPVRVVGQVAVGDYILPSGNQDGYGIAVHPDKMKLGDYARIVGVSWQAAPDAAANYVNVAVGINSNDLTHKMEEQQRQLEDQQRQIQELNQKVDRIAAFLEGKSPLPASAPALTGAPEKAPVATALAQTSFKTTLSDEEFDQMVDRHAARLVEFYAQLKVSLIEKGVDVSAPALAGYFDNTIETIKLGRRNLAFKTQWGHFDQQLKGKN